MHYFMASKELSRKDTSLWLNKLVNSEEKLKKEGILL